eukprot:Seg1008.9 transcript_id=Seg1008.9/GoldUCD/mRNA.D3Y31 product="hypothetical protein" protein_id=Seg1008.9/GoldUCD/D3Y31
MLLSAGAVTWKYSTFCCPEKLQKVNSEGSRMAEKELSGHKDEILNKEGKTLDTERNDELENAEEIVFDGVFDNLEVDDIYGDLKVDSLNDMNYTELKEKYENSTTEVKSLRKLSDKLKRENDILKTNIVSLYLTAKREIDRKDGELKIFHRKEVNYQLRLSKKERGKELEKEKGKGKGGKESNQKHGILNVIKSAKKTEYFGDKTENGMSSGGELHQPKDGDDSSVRQSHKQSSGKKPEEGDKTETGISEDKILSSQDSVDNSVRWSHKHSSGNKMEARWPGDKFERGSSGEKKHSLQDHVDSSVRHSHKHISRNKTEARWPGDKSETESSGDKTHSSHYSVDSFVRQSHMHASGNKPESSKAKKGHSSRKAHISSHSRHDKDEPGIQVDRPRDSKHKSSKRKSTVHKDGKKASRSGSHNDSSLSQPKRQKISS